MKEKNYQTIFNKWLKEVKKEVFVYKIPDCGFQNPFDSFSVSKNGKFSAWELKQTQTKSLPFSVVVPHQISALQTVINGNIVIKYPESFEIIPIENFIFERDRSKRKSLIYERAKAISTISIKL